MSLWNEWARTFEQRKERHQKHHQEKLSTWPKEHHAVYPGHCVLTSHRALQLFWTEEVLDVLERVICSDHMQKKRSCRKFIGFVRSIHRIAVALHPWSKFVPNPWLNYWNLQHWVCIMFFSLSSIRMIEFKYQVFRILGTWGVHLRWHWCIPILFFPSASSFFFFWNAISKCLQILWSQRFVLSFISLL